LRFCAQVPKIYWGSRSDTLEVIAGQNPQTWLATKFRAVPGDISAAATRASSAEDWRAALPESNGPDHTSPNW
jgi:hypothetical protein